MLINSWLFLGFNKSCKNMTKKITEFYVLEYSVSQNSYHVRTVSEMLENNHSNLEKQLSSDFAPLMFVESPDDAAHFVEHLSKAVDARLEADKKLLADIHRELRLAQAYSQNPAAKAAGATSESEP